MPKKPKTNQTHAPTKSLKRLQFTSEVNYYPQHSHSLDIVLQLSQPLLRGLQHLIILAYRET